MRVLVVDSETTGVDHAEDRVVEVAGVLLDDGVVVDTYESLVDPGRDVPPQASAVHHLTAEHLVGAPSLEDALDPMLSWDYHYIVAHNAKFDSGFLKPLGDRWICTWKCALRKWPDAPSHSNQVLRYWLGLAGPRSNSHAHRALYDAEVTANLFVRMLDESQDPDTVYEKMLEVSNTPALFKRVTFGVHRDKLWSEVPLDYIRWMLNKSSGWTEDQVYTAKYWYDRRTAA